MDKQGLIYRPKITIAGPCSAESREQLLSTARSLAAMGRVDILRAGVWKPRTSPNSFEGVGDVALEWLSEAKRLTGLPVATEVANAHHAKKALEAGVDVVWIGARTTNNPFSVHAFGIGLDIVCKAKTCDSSIKCSNDVGADNSLMELCVEKVFDYYNIN